MPVGVIKDFTIDTMEMDTPNYGGE